MVDTAPPSRQNEMSLFRICFGPLQPALHVTGTLALYIYCLLWKTRSTIQAEHYDHLPNHVLAPILLPKPQRFVSPPHFSAERPQPQGILLPRKALRGLQQCLGRWYMSK